MCFLPWEEWLPAWIVGPAMCLGAIVALASDRNLQWWDYVLLPPVSLLGAGVTYVWFKEGRHIFRDAEPPAQAVRNEDH